MRADRALSYLEDHPNTWIPVTSDETIDALRELKKAGHRIVTRIENDGARAAKYTPPEPQVLEKLVEAVKVETAIEAARRIFDGDIERVVTADGEIIAETPVVSPGQASRPFPLRRIETAEGWRIEVTEQQRCDCGDLYLIRADHERGEHHQNWLRGETQMETPTPDPQPTYKFPEGHVPDKFELGTVVVCPICKNKRLGERKKRDGTVTPARDYTTAPGHPDRRCFNCNGNGLIPNIGTIARGGSPDGPEPKPKPADEPAPGQLEVDVDGDHRRPGGAPGHPDDGHEAGAVDEPLVRDPDGNRPGPKQRKPRASRRRVQPDA